MVKTYDRIAMDGKWTVGPEDNVTTQERIDKINQLSSHLVNYKPTKREQQVGRSAAYYERLNQGKLPMREHRAKANQGQVPMVLRGNSLEEVDEQAGNGGK